MLVIRDAQLEALRRDVAIRALAQAHGELRQELGAAGFRTRAHQALDLAAARGFAGEDGERLAELALSLGPGFPDELPWAAAILGWSAPPTKKLAALEERAVREQLARLEGGQ